MPGDDFHTMISVAPCQNCLTGCCAVLNGRQVISAKADSPSSRLSEMLDAPILGLNPVGRLEWISTDVCLSEHRELSSSGRNLLLCYCKLRWLS
jgi:hypothetical protein